MRFIMIYKPWEIVLIPFPYTNLTSSKRRPAVVISPESYNSGLDIMLLFLTSNLKSELKEGDCLLNEWQEAGLPKPSKTRMKIMTLDKDFVIKKIGEIQSLDRGMLKQTLQNFFS